MGPGHRTDPRSASQRHAEPIVSGRIGPTITLKLDTTLVRSVSTESASGSRFSYSGYHWHSRLTSGGTSGRRGLGTDSPTVRLPTQMYLVQCPKHCCQPYKHW